MIYVKLKVLILNKDLKVKFRYEVGLQTNTRAIEGYYVICIVNGVDNILEDL